MQDDLPDLKSGRDNRDTLFKITNPTEINQQGLFVGMARFELATSWSQTRRDNRATLHPELLFRFNILFLSVLLARFELATFPTQGRDKITGLRYAPNYWLPFFKKILAERVGFEPTVQFNPYDDLANRSFRPLRHLSEIPILNLTLPFVRQMAEPLLTCPIIKGWQKYNCMRYHPKLNGKYV